jgi:hypothetical protein
MTYPRLDIPRSTASGFAVFVPATVLMRTLSPAAWQMPRPSAQRPLTPEIAR